MEVRTEELLRSAILSIPDFPIPGIDFKDITPLLARRDTFPLAIDALVTMLAPQDVDGVVAIESRGFLIGAPLASALRCGIVLMRKPGKLPGETDRFGYSCEYCDGTLEVRRGAVKSGGRYLIVDDLLATGGTARATADYLGTRNATVTGFTFLVELAVLEGRRRLVEAPVYSLLKY
jgi:adenine phosphoribosyltransferase